MSEGILLQALTNAVLALYGKPEPEARMGLDEIAAELHSLAREHRANRNGNER